MLLLSQPSSRLVKIHLPCKFFYATSQCQVFQRGKIPFCTICYAQYLIAPLVLVSSCLSTKWISSGTALVLLVLACCLPIIEMRFSYEVNLYFTAPLHFFVSTNTVFHTELLPTGSPLFGEAKYAPAAII